MIARLRLPILVMSIALAATACAKAEPPKPAFTGDISKGNPSAAAEASAQASGEAPEAVTLDAASMARLQQELSVSGEGCEILSTRSCLLPFPSDAYTVEDGSTGTGRRVNFPTGLLANTSGTTLDPTEWNRNDGFSPSTPILVQVPGLDPAKTNLPTEDNIGLSLTPKSATVIVNLDNGQLVPHWAEMDSHATSAADQVLILRPAVSLSETNRFAVALRDVKSSDGKAIPAPLSFQVLRDNNPTDIPQIESRRAQFDAIFTSLAGVGVNRADVYLSWHFTVASADSLAGRVLAMRDDAMGRLNGQAPKFKVTDTRTTDLQPGIAKIVKGTFDVPVYLDKGGVPGSRMTFDAASEQPVSKGTFTADFTCSVPSEAVKSGEATPVVYGHGLLGTSNEAASSQVQHTAAENNALYCATSWIGMSEEDIGNAVSALGNISNFPTVADRLQQGLVNALYLGRLLIHQNGLGSDSAFQTGDGASILNTASAYYDGNSQGGIMGGAVTAIAQDWTKASLGVTGMNYSTLLNRSVDFDEYAIVLREAYPNTLDQQLIFGVLQMLWDRGETSGYVQHLTDRPYDRTPAHSVILTVAYGDHQVAPVTAENIARTLRIPIYQPTLAEDRMPKGDMFWNLTKIRKFPLDGSALYFWDSGTLAPPLGNVTPQMSDAFKSECAGIEDPEEPPCADPHEDPRRQPAVIAQKKAFFAVDGKVTNVCHDEPCEAKPRSSFDY